MKSFSLKTRMALAVSLLFAVFIGGMSFITLTYLENAFKKNLAGQLSTLTAALTDSVDSKLEIVQKALANGAAKLPPPLVKDPEAAQRFLDDRIVLHSIFDNGLFLISKNGTLIAESPFLPKRRGRDLSFREFYKQTVASGKPFISKPYISTHAPGQPAVMMTVPILDKNGELTAILAGSFNMMGKNILQDISRLKIGKSGYVFMYHEDRDVIIHPDLEWRKQHPPAPGVNPLFDKALKGADITGETINSKEAHVVTSFHHLHAAKWLLGAAIPTSEAYAPLQRAKAYFLASSVTGMALVLTTVWLLMRRITAPLSAITRHVQTAGTDRHIPVVSDDEIGTLAKAFNAMSDTLKLEETALRESEIKFRALNSDLEQRVKERTAQLEVSNSELSSFCHAVSHDLRAPLRSINAFSSILQEEYAGELGGEPRDFLQRISSASLRMGELIDDLLNLSMVTRAKIKRERIDLSLMAQEILDEMGRNEPERAVEKTITPGISCIGDPSLIRAVMANLLGNAWKFTANAPSARITFDCRRSDGRTVYLVSDNGAGFSMAYVNKLFKPFERLHSAAEFNGSGIGLATVHRIISRHGGEVWADSEPGNGATFYFTLG